MSQPPAEVSIKSDTSLTSTPTLSPSVALDRTVVRGIAWTGALKWTAQFVTWAATIAIARLLSVRDYGIAGMAVLFLGLIQTLSEFGVGAAVVAFRDLARKQIAILNTFSLATGVCGLGICAMAAPLLAKFFATPEVAAVVVALGATFAISSLQTVPNAVLQREMRFKLISAIDALRAIVASVATLVMAAMHFGYWSLVLGNIIGAVVSTSATLIVRRQPFAVRGWSSVSGAIRYSSNIVGSRLSWYFYSNADFAVAGKFLGPSVLGFYTVAWTIANLPVDKITGVLNGVLPSVFSAVQKEKAAVRRYLLGLIEVLALVTLPICFGLALVAREAVPLLLGMKWQAAVLPLQILCILGATRSFFVVLSTALMMCGQSGFILRMSLAAAVVLPICFWIGSHWGAAGIAAGWLAGYPVIAVSSYRRITKVINAGNSGFFAAIRLPLLGSGCMAALVYLFGLSMQPHMTLAAMLVGKIIVGTMVYMGIVGLFGGRRIIAAIRMLRQSGISGGQGTTHAGADVAAAADDGAIATAPVRMYF